MLKPQPFLRAFYDHIDASMETANTGFQQIAKRAVMHRYDCPPPGDAIKILGMPFSKVILINI